MNKRTLIEMIKNTPMDEILNVNIDYNIESLGTLKHKTLKYSEEVVTNSDYLTGKGISNEK